MRIQQLSVIIIIIGIELLCDTVICFKTGKTEFGQATSLNRSGSTHYSMTTCALYRLAITYLQHEHRVDGIEEDFQANNGTCTDVHMGIAKELAKLNYSRASFRLAIQEISMANILTDVTYDAVPYIHFDDEQFELGSIFVMTQLKAIQSSLAHQEWTLARMALGAMLHAIQDFYSHSNWIELGMDEPNQDLATGRRLGSIADEKTRTCKDCDPNDENCARNNLIVDRKLTTGYFAYRYPPIKPPGKCNHGFLCYFSGSDDEYCEGISKDSPQFAHGHLHYRAAAMAYNASVKLLNELWKSTDTNAFGKLLGLSNSYSLVFVIDMSNRLNSLHEMIHIATSQLVDTMKTLTIKPSNYILAAFNSSHWGPIQMATHASGFVNLIQSLNEKDLQYPSTRYYNALNEALKICESESLVVLFTDGPDHKPYPKGLTLALANLKQTKIDILFTDGSKSKTETINELIDIADATGGLFVNVNISQPNIVQQFLFQRLQELANYESLVFKSLPSRRRGTFMVDSTVTSLRINVVATKPSFTVQITDPKDSVLEPISSKNGNYIQMFTIDKVTKSHIGLWTYNCNEDCTIEVSAKSEFRCRTQLYAALFEDVYTLMVTPPLVNQSDLFAITACDNSNEVFNQSMQLIGRNGEVLGNYSAKNSFDISIEIPSQSFRIRTIIGRYDGTYAYREERALTESSRIVMAILNQPLVAMNNESLNVSYAIRNSATKPLYVQLDIDNVLGHSRWYSIDEASMTDDFIIIDMNRYRSISETVRVIPLVFTLQAFKDKNTIHSDELLYRHEQIVPLYVQTEMIQLQAPKHLLDND